jgi:hypothetical protein
LPAAPKEQFDRLLAEAEAHGQPNEKLFEDTLWLEPMEGIVGFVEEVNGPGAEECREFVPTKHELLALAKYWLKEILDANFFFFRCNQSSSRMGRIRYFAHLRLGHIERILGSEALEAADDEVKAEFASGLDPRLWNMFVTRQEPARDKHGFPILPKE